MKHYKITDSKGQTRNETQWGENVTHEITLPGNTLCSNEVFHGYKTPGVAIFMNPAHGNYNVKTMLLWEAEGDVVADDGTKLGFKKQATVRQIEKPIITTEQRVEIAIKCAMEVCTDRQWRKWARDWINGTDRTYAAANAANAAAYAAYAAYAASAAYAVSAVSAANAAAYAANAVSAVSAAYTGKKINLDRIIKSVLEK